MATKGSDEEGVFPAKKKQSLSTTGANGTKEWTPLSSEWSIPSSLLAQANICNSPPVHASRPTRVTRVTHYVSLAEVPSGTHVPSSLRYVTKIVKIVNL